jgi:uncharacterized membrane-anchored protein YhcB (DUF1043 family)
MHRYQRELSVKLFFIIFGAILAAALVIGVVVGVIDSFDRLHRQQAITQAAREYADQLKRQTDAINEETRHLDITAPSPTPFR